MKKRVKHNSSGDAMAARKVRCPISPWKANENYDPMFAVIIKKAHQACLERDKSCTIFCCGDVGSGKSTLGFWAYEIVDPAPDVARIGWSQQTFAEAIGKAKGLKAPFIMHDEGNINSRDAMSEKNKDVIDLLFSVRGKNWFLWMNNPSVKSIDKTIVEEGLVNLFFFVHKEQERYLLFTRTGMLQLLKNHGSISFFNLKTYGPIYAVYDGWFHKYNKDLWKEYLKIKNERMDEKIENFVKKYTGGELKTIRGAADEFGMSFVTVEKAFKWGAESHFLVEGRDYAKNAANRPKLTTKGVENLRFVLENRLYKK